MKGKMRKPNTMDAVESEGRKPRGREEAVEVRWEGDRNAHY
jgi:hypothetical protein